MGVLNPDGTPYISGVDPQPNIRRELVTPVQQTAGRESGSAKRRRKAIERRDYWTNEENNE